MPSQPKEPKNPLLLGWLKEWWDEAKERQSKGTLTYKKAYESMKACPIVFDHPSQVVQLNGLGPKLAERLTAKLEEHCRDHGLPMPEMPHKAKKRTSDEGVADSAPPKKARTTKPYVPKLRSGPYAILLGLSTDSETEPVGLTKTQLIEEAQPHSDSSFTAPSDVNNHYTAWNSMKTLQSKDLVYDFGRPTKLYALTESGWETVKRIKKASGRDGDGSQSGNAAAPIPAAPMKLDAAQECAPKPAQSKRDPAEIALISPSAAFRAPPTSDFQNLDVIALDDDDDETADSVARLPVLSVTAAHAATKRLLGFERSKSDVLSRGAAQVSAPPKLDRHPSAPTTVLSSPPASPRKSRVAMTTSFTPIRVPAHAYTVELVIDTREVRSKTDRDYIQNGLVDQQVVPTTRGLPLGDALWVARLNKEHATLLSNAGEDGAPSEILLGNIMERKRLDDLIGSIKDGRFHEQKFRLKRSGVPNVTYLIEDTQLGELPERTLLMIDSAIAGTMTVSGFFVKRTRKLDDSIAYMARMTKMLRRRYEGKDLLVVPSRSLGDGRDISRIQALLKDEAHFLTFDAFAAMSSKNDSLVLRDVFLKMLMCTRGVSGDKALEIQRRWKTPRAFIEALEKKEIDGGADGSKRRREMVWKSTDQLVGRKQIGRALSMKVADIWGEA